MRCFEGTARPAKRKREFSPQASRAGKAYQNWTLAVSGVVPHHVPKKSVGDAAKSKN
ncbi:MAG: hypothetical protein ABSF80_11270 [Chitinispirillaceae bacterium]